MANQAISRARARAAMAAGLTAAGLSGAAAQSVAVPDAVAPPAGERVIMTLHAEGAQVYECKADQAGQLVWTFREPVATLFDMNGRTVGRHFAGPHWELDDGGRIAGRVTGRAPGATANDIPLLRLEVSDRKGQGALSPTTTILRLKTVGGVASGPCPQAGRYLSVGYATEYVFLARP